MAFVCFKHHFPLVFCWSGWVFCCNWYKIF